MFIRSLLNDPARLRLLLFALAGVCLLFAFWLHRSKQKKKMLADLRSAPPAAGPGTPGPEVEAPETASELAEEGTGPGEPEPLVIHYESFRARLSRAALVLLACLVAFGFVVLILPEKAVVQVIQSLQAIKAADRPEDRIALIYLGDEIKAREFHIRGVIRNLADGALEGLDATIRLYSPEGQLLETVVVRTDPETIAPDAVANLHLVYPDYRGQFGSYSVDFKLRSGEPVSYKDRRGTRFLK